MGATPRESVIAQAIVAEGLGGDVQQWLKSRNIRYDRAFDLPRQKIWTIPDKDCGAPDQQFAVDPVGAVLTTQRNIQSLEQSARRLARLGISNDPAYVLPDHAAILACIAAERAILIWMERTITIRACVPARGAA